MDKKYSRETLCVQAGWTPKKVASFKAIRAVELP